LRLGFPKLTRFSRSAGQPADGSVDVYVCWPADLPLPNRYTNCRVVMPIRNSEWAGFSAAL
jgi:hypothetical protein